MSAIGGCGRAPVNGQSGSVDVSSSARRVVVGRVHGLLAAAGVMLGLSFSVVGAQEPTQPQESGEDHAALFADDRFPSATACAPCHEDIYREWSVSSHAYAQMSPVFNAMHATILKQSNGTNGDFCIRCHTPVGMNLEEPEFMSNLDPSSTSREGITCGIDPDSHRLACRARLTGPVVVDIVDQ